MRYSRQTIICVCLTAVISFAVIMKMANSFSATSLNMMARLSSCIHKQRVDVIDNSPAVASLAEVSRRFKPPNQEVPIAADPNRPETIRTWWQALAMIDWYMGAPVRYNCSNLTHVGNWMICQDEPYTVSPPCLVYSFGINWDFSFDDAMAKIGCEVHSFDPSMKKDDHKRGNRSTFHNLGIGSYNTDSYSPIRDSYVKDNQTWKVRTVKAIMRELGHENRVIDVFKMDVETYEWAIIDNMLETDVFRFIRQFDLEYHLYKEYPPPQEYVLFYQAYTRLRESGFRAYFRKQHQRKIQSIATLRLQTDAAYVNALFDPSNLWG